MINRELQVKKINPIQSKHFSLFIAKQCVSEDSHIYDFVFEIKCRINVEYAPVCIFFSNCKIVKICINEKRRVH